MKPLGGRFSKRKLGAYFFSMLLIVILCLLWQRNPLSLLLNNWETNFLSKPKETTLLRGSSYDEEAKLIEEMGQKEGAGAAYEYLKSLYGTDQVRGHDLAHTIGHLAYEQNGVVGLALCDANFAFGCSHGFLSELIKETGLQDGLKTAEQACGKLTAPGPIASCLHGLGHGVMAETLDIDQAIKECRNLEGNHSLYCFDGAYMEYYVGTMTGDIPAKDLPPQETYWEFCLSQPIDTQTQCVRNHTAYLLSGSTPKSNVVASCSQLEKKLADFCIQAVGLFATQNDHTPSLSPQTLCSLYTKTPDQTECISFAAKEIVFEGRPLIQASALCETLEITEQKQCFSAIEETKNEYQRK